MYIPCFEHYAERFSMRSGSVFMASSKRGRSATSGNGANPHYFSFAKIRYYTEKSLIPMKKNSFFQLIYPFLVKRGSLFTLNS